MLNVKKESHSFRSLSENSFYASETCDSLSSTVKCTQRAISTVQEYSNANTECLLSENNANNRPQLLEAAMILSTEKVRRSLNPYNQEKRGVLNQPFKIDLENNRDLKFKINTLIRGRESVMSARVNPSRDMVFSIRYKSQNTKASEDLKKRILQLVKMDENLQTSTSMDVNQDPLTNIVKNKFQRISNAKKNLSESKAQKKDIYTETEQLTSVETFNKDKVSIEDSKSEDVITNRSKTNPVKLSLYSVTLGAFQMKELFKDNKMSSDLDSFETKNVTPVSEMEDSRIIKLAKERASKSSRYAVNLENPFRQKHSDEANTEDENQKEDIPRLKYWSSDDTLRGGGPPTDDYIRTNPVKLSLFSVTLGAFQMKEMFKDSHASHETDYIYGNTVTPVNEDSSELEEVMKQRVSYLNDIPLWNKTFEKYDLRIEAPVPENLDKPKNDINDVQNVQNEKFEEKIRVDNPPIIESKEGHFTVSGFGTQGVETTTVNERSNSISINREKVPTEYSSNQYEYSFTNKDVISISKDKSQMDESSLFLIEASQTNPHLKENPDFRNTGQHNSHELSSFITQNGIDEVHSLSKNAATSNSDHRPISTLKRNECFNDGSDNTENMILEMETDKGESSENICLIELGQAKS